MLYLPALEDVKDKLIKLSSRGVFLPWTHVKTFVNSCELDDSLYCCFHENRFLVVGSISNAEIMIRYYFAPALLNHCIIVNNHDASGEYSLERVTIVMGNRVTLKRLGDLWEAL